VLAVKTLSGLVEYPGLVFLLAQQGQVRVVVVVVLRPGQLMVEPAVLVEVTAAAAVQELLHQAQEPLGPVVTVPMVS